MEAIHSPKMSVVFQWTTQHYMPEDSTLHNYHCENLKEETAYAWKNTLESLVDYMNFYKIVSVYWLNY
jgi:hypothetical protein